LSTPDDRRTQARPTKPRPPTPAELRAARNKGIRDVIAPGLKLLLVGVNPGL
jgi:TDG/mug DNA glycosylase family protein